MILSRFWTFLLTGVAIIGIAAALLAASLINEQYQRTVRNDLVRDRFEVEAILKLDARTRLDAIAPIAANGDVRTALRRASARRDRSEVEEEISTALRAKLTELNGQLAGMRGDLLFAVDDQGWIIAGISPTPLPDGSGLGQFPLVRRALEGYIRDDVWVYNDGVYRMAARPVIEGGQYVGALVHGKRFDDGLAELLSTRLDGASVAFFRGDGMVAGYMPSGVQGAPRRDDMGAMLTDVLTNEALQNGERTEPIALGTGGLAVFSLVTGTSRFANVGYAIARPVRSLARPSDIFDHASGEAWAGLPWEYLGGGGVLIFLLSMFFVWVERDRPLSNLKKAAEELEGAADNRLTITDFGGRYRKIANAVNKAIDKAAEAGGGPKRQAANLDELLGPAEAAAASGSFFGFQGDDAPAPDFQAPPGSPAGALPPPGSPAGGLPPIGGSGLGAPPPPGGGAPPPPAKARPKPPPPRPPAPKVPAPPKAAAPAPPSEPLAPPPSAHPSIGEEDEEEATALVAPPPSQRRALKSTLMGVAPPSDDDDDDDGATRVARVPQELLDSSAIAENEEETHFRDVFQKFVATKKQCGEPTANVTFEKFAVTLRKNRDQIVKRHGAAKVRFTVYTKNGKAALKATPIKN